jgi:small conductance mechanosensitive channel
MIPLQFQMPSEQQMVAADSTYKAHMTEKIDAFAQMTPSEMLHTISSGIIEVALKILLALVIYFIGRWVIRKVRKLMLRIFERRDVDVSLRAFLLNLVQVILMVLLIIIIIDVLGISTASFIALFASVGVAMGMALSGTLQNFAGGVMILLVKPYRVGDFIEAEGVSGTVKNIMLFNTVINTPDNKTILIPNSTISTDVIHNYSREPRRRVEWVIGISYGDDFATARQAIAELLDKDTRILRDPAYLIEITELAASSVNIVVRAWTASADYWNVYFDINREVYQTLPAKGVNFPFNQLDVHLTK